MSSPANSLGGTAYDVLRAEILAGHLAPGQKLRPSALRGQYDLGLTPIREALMRLTSEGLATFTERRGATVRAATLDEFRELMDTRRDVETICLSRAIARGDDAWEADILRAHHLLTRARLPGTDDDPQTATDWETAHRQFHFALVSACGSTWHLDFWNTLADHSERYRRLRLREVQSSLPDVEEMNAQHENIMKAVIDRDPARACNLMSDHLAGTERFVVNLFENRTMGDPA
ncbi:GntR family transcriptional regulator [Jannaschia sp. 2305UL9-9]|uniref:GntR family transcriptional regulator n=1 Tax=Jannaschia sp. 2305UL9-9 TaxID=3121638 RepID=UPI003528219A